MEELLSFSDIMNGKMLGNKQKITLNNAENCSLLVMK